jgi:hypothetical protein
MFACTKPGVDVNAPKDEAVAPPATEAPATTATPAEAPSTEAAATTATETPAAAPATEAAPAAATPAGATGLEGSTWKIGEFTVLFKDATTINVKGGPVPDGIDGTYKVENGNITINVLTETKTGTWDGKTLVIDGKNAEKQ